MAMGVALAAHDDVLRSAIRRHDGWLFKHTVGGVCAAFASPRSAVDAAVSAQRALDLPVPMGIATGEAEPRGTDYFVVVINRAARVMAAGHGGQILLADSTAGLLNGVDLVDLGPRRLRDLPSPALLAAFWTVSDGTNRRPPPPVTQSTPSPPRRSPESTPQSLIYVKSSATRLANRSRARARR